MDLFTRAEQRSAPPLKKSRTGGISLEILHQMECRACPLNKADVSTPKMVPAGASAPLLYVLGGAPSTKDDEAGGHGAGPVGQLVRNSIQEDVLERTRFNTVIRTMPPDERSPDPIEIECCRPSIVRDIEATKPLAIVGLGNVPLRWLTGQSGIEPWRGRRMPVRVGTHVCWFFPLMDPVYVLHMAHARGEGKLGKEYTWAFKRDMNRAAASVLAGLPVPVVHTPQQARDGVQRFVPGPGALVGLTQAIERIMSGAEAVGLDYETTHLRPYFTGAAVLSVAISNGTESVAFTLDHPAYPWRGERAAVFELVRSILLANIPKVAHNAKFELEWSGVMFGEDTVRAARWECSQAIAYVLDCRAGSGAQSLGGVAVQEFGLDIKQLSSVNITSLASGPVDQLLLYNGIDAKYALLLFQRLFRRATRLGLGGVYVAQRQRLPTIAQAQIDGVPVNMAKVRAFEKDLTTRVANVKREIANLVDVQSYVAKFGRFNPESPDEVGKLLRDHLQRPEGNQRNGKYSTDKEALDKMTSCPVAGKILELRGIAKLLSTYIVPLLPGPDSLVYPDGLLHTNFNTTFTDTGRLSSSEPNLQNFPKRKNAEIRSVVAPGQHEVVVAADYGQIEARMIAVASQDKRLTAALWDNYDIHLAWAEELARMEPKLLKARGGNMKLLRSDTKNLLVFPAFYGAFPQSIAAALQVDDQNKVNKLFEKFWHEFAGVKKWQDNLLKQYEIDGFVTCLTGRRRYGPLNRNMILNSPIQGTASDLVVGAMNRLSVLASRDVNNRHLQARMNIHDDLTFIMPKSKLDSAIPEIVRQMVTVKYDWVTVPISVEVAVGADWFSLKEVGRFESHKI